MVVQRILGMTDSNDEINVRARWRGLPESENWWKPPQNESEDVP